MGIINFFKKLFKKSLVERPDKFSNELIYTYTPKNGRFKVDEKLVVSDNAVAILVVKRKMADVFESGKHKLSVDKMPLATKYLSLNKLNKKNELKSEFKGKIFFLNTNNYENISSGNNYRIPIFDKVYKNIYGYVFFNYSFKILDYKKFLKIMLNERQNFAHNVAFHILGDYVEEMLAEALTKQRLSVEDFASKSFFNLTKIETHIYKKLKEIGIEMYDFNLSRVKIPDRLLRKIRERGCDLVFDEDEMSLSSRADVQVVEPQEEKVNIIIDERNNQSKNEQGFNFEIENAKINSIELFQNEQIENTENEITQIVEPKNIILTRKEYEGDNDEN